MLQSIDMGADMCYKYSIVEFMWLVAMYYRIAADYKTVLTKFAARFPQTPVPQSECLQIKVWSN